MAELRGDEAAASRVGFGGLLRAHRERRLLSQERLAERSGLSARTIRDLELGRVRHPRGESVRLLADALLLAGWEREQFEAAARGAPMTDRPGGQPLASAPGNGTPWQPPPEVADLVGRARPRRLGQPPLAGSRKEAPSDGLKVGSPMAAPSTTPPTAAGTERDVLLATKLHVPRPHPGFVARQRLLEQLDDGMARELVLVCTPAGFGKTALLADWARRSRRPVAWLSLDDGDNDPTRFWRHVAAALDRLRPGVAERVATLLGPPPPRSFEGLVTALVNELASVDDEVVLVLDDCHLVQAAAVHQPLESLLEHLPGSLRLVVASRADPPLPLARLRARGQLAELRAADLRFTRQEAAALLRTAVGPELPEAAVAALEDRTEGWAAGLQLAALSLRGHADPAGFVATFSGSHRYILDYLTQEVLARQPEQLREFLLESSVLERLSGPLSQAVTGRADSQQLLEAIERANLFLVPLDEVRGWWRYHHLFADLLRARLQETRPERLPALHHNAAAWCQQHGLADDAVRHALAAGEVDWAARLVEEHLQARFQRSEGVTVNRWLGALPAELVNSRPPLLVARAVWAIVGGRVEEVEPLLQAAERTSATLAGKPPEPSTARTPSGLGNVPAMIPLLRAELARERGDAERTIQFARQGLALADEDDRYLRYLGRWHLAVGTLLQGRVGDAEAALAELAADPWAAEGDRYFAVRARYTLAQGRRAQGRLGAALRSCQQALELAAQPGRPPPPAAGVAHVGLAEVLYEQGELDAADQHAAEGVELCRQLAYPLPLVAGLAILAWIRHAQGDATGALAAIGEAERVQVSPAVVTLFNPVPVLGARLALANGDVAEAAHWIEQRGLAPDDQPSYPREGESLVLARVLLAQQQPDRALRLLERLHTLAVAQGRTGSVIEVRALQALALDAASDQAGALAALAEALTLAAPEGYLRVFVDEGAPMARLFGTLATSSATGKAVGATHVPAAYLRRLLDAVDQAGVAVPPGLVVPLSSRELQVLALLGAGTPNQTIAEELVISLHTVKRHVTHIFDKLGAANRTEAVNRARELGLLR
jgi:LuxR family transcriptional regulator, maltose regulon positive regulatory protein